MGPVASPSYPQRDGSQDMTPIPVTERVPDQVENVAVYDAVWGWRTGYYSPDFSNEDASLFVAGGWRVWGVPEWYTPVVTHWLPLPPNPNEHD